MGWGVHARHGPRDRGVSARDSARSGGRPGPSVTPAGLRGRLRAQGRDIVDGDGNLFRPLFASCLSALAPGRWDSAVALLDQLAALGFGGVRVFAGHLEWAGQTAAAARAQLTAFIEACRDRGLYVLISAITDSALEDYDLEAHIDAIGAICAQYDNTILEIANEPYHPTQRSQVHDFGYLRQLAARVPDEVLVGLGAAANDEALDARDGEYVPIHLDRSRDEFNEVRRVREAEAVEQSTGKAAWIQETTKAAAVTQEGKWESDSRYFYALGLNARLFEVALVFHSEDGLQAQPLDAATEACARDCVAGFTAIPLDVPSLQYHNAGDPASPVRAANFDNVVRCHSAIDGNRGWTFAEGLALNGDGSEKDPGITWNWPVHEQIDARPQLRLYAAMH